MSAAITYYLCMRRLGNRNKGIAGSSYTGLTIGSTSGIITNLGNSGTLTTQDATYRANPTQANFSPMRAGVAALPTHVFTLTISSSATYDGDDRYRLANLTALLNKINRLSEERDNQIVVPEFNSFLRVPGAALTGVSTTFAGFSQNNASVISAFFAGQHSTGAAGLPGPTGAQGGFRRKNFNYFITTKNPAT